MSDRVFYAAKLIIAFTCGIWLFAVVPSLILDHAYKGWEIIALISHVAYPVIVGLALWLARTRNRWWLLLALPETIWLLTFAAFIAYAIISA